MSDKATTVVVGPTSVGAGDAVPNEYTVGEREEPERLARQQSVMSEHSQTPASTVAENEQHESEAPSLKGREAPEEGETVPEEGETVHSPTLATELAKPTPMHAEDPDLESSAVVDALTSVPCHIGDGQVTSFPESAPTLRSNQMSKDDVPLSHIQNKTAHNTPDLTHQRSRNHSAPFELQSSVALDRSGRGAEGSSESPKVSHPRRLKGWSLVAHQLTPQTQAVNKSHSLNRHGHQHDRPPLVVGSVVRKAFIDTVVNGRPLVFWLRAEEREEQLLRIKVEADEEVAFQAIVVAADASLIVAAKVKRRENVMAANIKQREKEEIQRWKQLRYRVRQEENEGRVVVFLVEDRAFRELVTVEKTKRQKLLNAARNRKAGGSTGRVPVTLEHSLAEHLRKMKIRPQDRLTELVVPFEQRPAQTFSGLSPEKSPHYHLSTHHLAAVTPASATASPESISRLPPITLSPISESPAPTNLTSPATRGGSRSHHNTTVILLQRVGRGYTLRRGPVTLAKVEQPPYEETVQEWHETNAIRRLLTHHRKAAMPNRKEFPDGYRETHPDMTPATLEHSFVSPTSKSRVSTAHSRFGSTLSTVATSPQPAVLYDRKILLDDQAKEAALRKRRLRQMDADLSKSQMHNQLQELKALRELQRIKEECEREKVTLREKRKLEKRKAKIVQEQMRFREESRRLRVLDQREIDRVELHVALRQKHMGETRIEALKRTLVELPGANRIASMSAQLSVAKAERTAKSD